MSIEVDQQRTFDTRCKLLLSRVIHEGVLRRPQARPLIVLTTSRSGSTWLCDILSRASRGGPIAEHLRPEHFEALVHDQSAWPDLQKAFSELSMLLTRRKFCGSKLIWDYFPDLEEKFPDDSLKNIFDQLMACDPLIVRLQRQDRAEQAISRYIAFQTGIYHRTKASKLEDLDYDFEKIRHHYEILTRAEAHLDNFLPSLHRDFLSLQYEEARGDPKTSMLKPLGKMLTGAPSQAYLQKRLDIALEKSTLRATKTERNIRWQQTFLADMKKQRP